MSARGFEQAQNAALARFGVEAESRFIDIAAIDGQAHVLVAGEGPPVVLFNGIGCPAAMWAPLLPELRGYRVYAIDRPGCGLTSGAIAETATLRQESVRFLEQALDQLELECPAFLANSMGSLWCIWLALDRPERVAASVHVGTPALILGTSAPLPMRLMSIPPIGRLLMKLQPPSVKRMDQTAAMVHVELHKEPEVREAMVESERMPGAADTFLSLLNACLRLRGARPEVALTAEQLSGLRHPVQLLWADDDPFGDVEVGGRVADLIPDAELHVVPGGHAPWVNAPTQLGRLATTFLNERYATPLRARERSETSTAATRSASSRNDQQSSQSG
jgi:pimeloyl-ACP methyl ester carboxylesterase